MASEAQSLIPLLPNPYEYKHEDTQNRCRHQKLRPTNSELFKPRKMSNCKLKGVKIK